VVGLAFDDGARNNGLVDGMAGKIGLRLAGTGVRAAAAAGGGKTCLLLAGGAGKGSRSVDFLLIATMFFAELVVMLDETSREGDKVAGCIIFKVLKPSANLSNLNKCD